VLRVESVAGVAGPSSLAFRLRRPLRGQFR
jgi:hypothetical protein